MSAETVRVGPFEVVEPINHPLAGSWFLATRAGEKQRHPVEVIVKVLDPESGDLAQLHREFDRLRTLDDPRIPGAVGFYEGSRGYALEAEPGVSLAELVQRRIDGTMVMTPATLLDLALELSATIQYTHERGRHHGHLDPSKVWLTQSGKLMVWGYGPGPRLAPKPEWMAPERARGEHVTGATDQWALGAMLAALVTGKTPWRGVDPVEEARRGDVGTLVSAVIAQWPALGKMLRRLLDNNPRNRYSSIHPARQDLMALARKAGGVSERKEVAAKLFASQKVDPVSLDVPHPAELSEQAEAPMSLDEAARARAKEESAARPEPLLAANANGTVSEVSLDDLAEEEPPAELKAADSLDLAVPAAASRLPESSGPLPNEAFAVVRPDLEGDDIEEATTPVTVSRVASPTFRLNGTISDDSLDALANEPSEEQLPEVQAVPALRLNSVDLDDADQEAIPTEMATPSATPEPLPLNLDEPSVAAALSASIGIGSPSLDVEAPTERGSVPQLRMGTPQAVTPRLSASMEFFGNDEPLEAEVEFTDEIEIDGGDDVHTDAGFHSAGHLPIDGPPTISGLLGMDPASDDPLDAPMVQRPKAFVSPQLSAPSARPASLRHGDGTSVTVVPNSLDEESPSDPFGDDVFALSPTEETGPVLGDIDVWAVDAQLPERTPTKIVQVAPWMAVSMVALGVLTTVVNIVT